ncbi:hypothetical protein ACI2JG_24960, partial [Pseudomonas psychrophila]
MILPWLILIPFIGGLLCWLGERFGSTLPRWIALLTMSLELALGLWLWSQGNYSFAPAPGADPTWALEFQHTWIARFGISVHLALGGQPGEVMAVGSELIRIEVEGAGNLRES